MNCRDGTAGGFDAASPSSDVGPLSPSEGKANGKFIDSRSDSSVERNKLDDALQTAFRLSEYSVDR